MRIGNRAAAGFTLLELIAVIAIAAILAISATAMFSRLAFDTASFGRELESTLAYAQKQAVAERRTVSVSVAASSVTFTICQANPCGASVPLVLPTRDGVSVLTAPSGVTLAPTGNFTFSPSGAASAAVTITVTGDGSNAVVVEATGYVHS